MKRHSHELVVVFLLFSSSAMASGTLQLPPQKERLESPHACLDYLRDRAADDEQQAMPETIGADGTRRQVMVEPKSKGVELQGRHRARYAARIWYSNGRPMPDIGQIEYRTSWEEHSFECRGRELTTRRSNGYTSESFQPLDTAKP